MTPSSRIAKLILASFSWRRQSLYDPVAYPPVLRELLAERRLNALGPGQPNEVVRPRLAGLTAALAFIDLCEAAYRGRTDCEPLCRLIQEQEWHLLFDHCVRHALGRN